MAEEIALVPKPLSTTEKRAMKQWLESVLADPELSSNTATFPLSNRIVLYHNGDPKIVLHGLWNAADLRPHAETGDIYIRAAVFDPRRAAPSKTQRLAVLGGIIGAVNLWDDFKTQYSAAVGRTILEAYNSCFHNMIQAPRPAVKLAFSADHQQVAVQYDGDDAFYLNNGEPIEVGEGWQVVAA